MSQQIIGNHKEFIVLERKELENLEQALKKVLKETDIHTELNKRAYYSLDIVEWIKENNLYTKDFQIKN